MNRRSLAPTSLARVLAFADSAREARYQAARDCWLRTRVPFVTVVIAVIFLAFCFFDRYAAPGQALLLAAVRTGTGVVLVSLGWYAGRPASPLSLTALSAWVAVTIYTGMILTHVIVGANPLYRFTGAMMLIQTGVWFLGGMTFGIAALVNMVAITVFVALEAFVIGVSWIQIGQTTLYFLALAVVGGISAYANEKQFRENFANHEELAAQRNEYRARAMRDGLTGLWNRRAMEERIAAAAHAMPAGRGSCAVLMLDLDGFKPINDQHGHHAGDEALVAVARRISSVLRPGDSVGRIGGDEFLVLAEGLDAPEDARQLADRMRKRIEAPMRVRVRGDSATVEVHLGVSIGIVTFSDPAEVPDALVQRADALMYRDKGERKPDAGGSAPRSSHG